MGPGTCPCPLRSITNRGWPQSPLFLPFQKGLVSESRCGAALAGSSGTQPLGVRMLFPSLGGRVVSVLLTAAPGQLFIKGERDGRGRHL